MYMEQDEPSKPFHFCTLNRLTQQKLNDSNSSSMIPSKFLIWDQHTCDETCFIDHLHVTICFCTAISSGISKDMSTWSLYYTLLLHSSHLHAQYVMLPYCPNTNGYIANHNAKAEMFSTHSAQLKHTILSCPHLSDTMLQQYVTLLTASGTPECEANGIQCYGS